MSNAFHDGNGMHTLILVKTDGVGLVNAVADPISHSIHINDGITGSDNGPTVSRHDASNMSVLVATSRTDGLTPVIVYADASGNVLVDSV